MNQLHERLIERYQLPTTIEQRAIDPGELSDCFYSVVGQQVIIELIGLFDTDLEVYELRVYLLNNDENAKRDYLLVDDHIDSIDEATQIHRRLFDSFDDAMNEVFAIQRRVVANCYC